MAQNLGYVALIVRDYDEAITFFTQTLGFTLFEDTDLGRGKRWVLVAPPNSRGMKERGVRFRETPREEEYGTVAVFENLYGNTWDLLQLKAMTRGTSL